MTIGILGGGQLGRMLALAGIPLGFRFRFFDPVPDACAGEIAPLICAPYEDQKSLRRFADGLDVVTFEFENVPIETAQFLSALAPVYPPIEALERSQDRLVEKRILESIGVPVARYAAVNSVSDLKSAQMELGLPLVVKSRRLGYDGKGQAVLRSERETDEFVAGFASVPSIVEKFLPFDSELSSLSVHGSNGEVAFYAVTENVHRDGILRSSRAPAPDLTAHIVEEARWASTALGRALGYRGVLAIEFFRMGDRLFANEFAPRVHNSGHWTIEGAKTNQFENHLRAIAGLPLGDTSARGHSFMLNLIGSVPDVSQLVGFAGANVHLYGKEARPGRKLGHVTLTGVDCGPQAASSIERLLRLVDRD